MCVCIYIYVCINIYMYIYIYIYRTYCSTTTTPCTRPRGHSSGSSPLATARPWPCSTCSIISMKNEINQ